VNTGPAGERAAGPGSMRTSHADRDQVIGALKAAFVHGRLAKDELDVRVGQALTARTHAELAVLTDNIPATPARATAEPPPLLLGVRSGACVTTLAAAPAVTGFVIFTLFVTGYQMREARRSSAARTGR